MIIRTIVRSDAWCRSAVKTNEANTFSNGCLGSHIDEERSEMRYVMRIAKPVSHQNFERNLHFPRGVCLLECLFIPTPSTTSQRMSRRSGLPVVRVSCSENAATVHAPRCKTYLRKYHHHGGFSTTWRTRRQLDFRIREARLPEAV